MYITSEDSYSTRKAPFDIYSLLFEQEEYDSYREHSPHAIQQMTLELAALVSPIVIESIR